MSTENKYVFMTLRGQVAEIRFCNPPLGVIDELGATELFKAIHRAIDDQKIKTIILTGTDDVFVRHYDINSLVMAAEALQSHNADIEDFLDAPFHRLTEQLRNTSKPVIAAINGHCMGGGLELALACDFRFAATSVRHIGLPEIKLGIFPGGGATQLLPRLIGQARAAEFIMLGKVIDAGKASQLGLVHSVHENVLEYAHQIANALAARPASSLGTIKALLNISNRDPVSEGLLQERRYFAEMLRDDRDALIRMKQFLEQNDFLENLD